MAGILLIFSCISPGVYAMELGGFDVETGVDDGADWSDWDEDEAGSVVENGTSGGMDSGTENTYEETDNTAWEESSGWESESWQDKESGVKNRTNTGNTGTLGQKDAGSSVWTGQMRAGNNDSMEAGGYGQTYTESTERAVLNTAKAPTDTPVPVPSPTIKPTATPTPAFTEVPESEADKVTEFHEEYRIPPAKCMTKMKLVYWKEKVREGEKMEIRLDHRVVAAVVSLRINGQEISWTTEAGYICIRGLTEREENQVELAIMVPMDLPWTKIKKNAILSYNVF